MPEISGVLHNVPVALSIRDGSGNSVSGIAFADNTLLLHPSVNTDDGNRYTITDIKTGRYLRQYLTWKDVLDMMTDLVNGMSVRDACEKYKDLEKWGPISKKGASKNANA